MVWLFEWMILFEIKQWMRWVLFCVKHRIESEYLRIWKSWAFTHLVFKHFFSILLARVYAIIIILVGNRMSLTILTLPNTKFKCKIDSWNLDAARAVCISVREYPERFSRCSCNTQYVSSMEVKIELHHTIHSNPKFLSFFLLLPEI